VRGSIASSRAIAVRNCSASSTSGASCCSSSDSRPFQAPTGRSQSANGGQLSGRRSAARTPKGRAPRGQNRRLILEALSDAPKTAGDVAKETGIGRPTVSTTLTKLVSDGAAVKVNRGYKAA
jgi:DNA-binding transcriptional ArsR family regulator